MYEDVKMPVYKLPCNVVGSPGFIALRAGFLVIMVSKTLEKNFLHSACNFRPTTVNFNRLRRVLYSS